LKQESEPAPPTGHLAAGASFHEQLAGTWNDGYKRGGFRKRMDLVERRLGQLVRPGEFWLDIGCGAGLLTMRLAHHGAIGLGVDGSPRMIQAANGLALKGQEQRVKFQLIQTVEKMDLPGSSFDGILCSSVLEYVDHPGMALDEMCRLLKPGGKLLISVANSFSAVRVVQHVARAVAGVFGSRDVYSYLDVSRVTYSKRSIRRALGDRGLKVEAIEEFDPLVPAALAWLLPSSMIFVTAARV